MFYLIALLVVGCSISTDALLPGFYCGNENCYDVLNVNRDSSKSEIAKSYRKLAGKYHPDRNRGSPEETEKAEERFKIVAVAYETLKDEESRRDYDYMLDNPDEVYRHYYYYYRHRVAPKVDVRLVILATILIMSAIQPVETSARCSGPTNIEKQNTDSTSKKRDKYISAWQKYREAITYLFTQPKYRIKASEIAKERGLLPLKENTRKGKRRQVDKQEAKEEEDAIIKAIIEENIDMNNKSDEL
uniref:J domain-containing protein n=1 Tax=Romanomermis culicivorax TaxID=13658 RepID=A0A915I3Y1_ROMCU